MADVMKYEYDIDYSLPLNQKSFELYAICANFQQLVTICDQLLKINKL